MVISNKISDNSEGNWGKKIEKSNVTRKHINFIVPTKITLNISKFVLNINNYISFTNYKNIKNLIKIIT